MFKRKTNKTNSNKKSITQKNYYDDAMEWEVSRTLLSAQSERRAWKISTFLLVILFFSWIGLFLMLPLKKDIPYVIQVDNVTGRTEISQVYNPERLTFNEIRDKYWINYFIRLYEKYNFYTLPNDYNEMPLFAEDAVLIDYQNMYQGENARQKMYKDDIKIDVDIISILIKPSRNDTFTASIRFSITKVGMRVNPSQKLDSRIYTAELTYKYETLDLDPKSRLINPLGFRVIDYQLAADN